MCAIKRHLDYPQCETKNQWCSVDAHFQNGVGSVLELILHIKAANTWFITVCHQLPFRLPKMYKQQLLVLAMGLGNLPAVRVLASGSVRFGSLPNQKPDPLCLGGFVTWTGHKPAGFWPGWNRTTVPTLQFVHICLQLSIWVLIVSWHDQFVE